MKCTVKKIKFNSKEYENINRFIKIGFLVEKYCGEISYLIGLSKYLKLNYKNISDTQKHNDIRVIGGFEGKICLKK